MVVAIANSFACQRKARYTLLEDGSRTRSPPLDEASVSFYGLPWAAARDGVLWSFALDELDAYTIRACQIGNAGTRDKFVRFNRKFAPFFPDDVAELSQVTDYFKAKMIRAPLVVTHKIIKRLQGIL
jgi:hypothetical protein